MVYYRKYRPQTISELDSEVVRETLSSSLFGKSVPHAFLFTGPKGLGKTSAARIVAKAVNCERRNKELGIRNQGKNNRKKNHNSSFIIHHSSSIEPCNKCTQCTSITEGTNLDILEIDGASNRGIDEIRDLREKVRLAPMSARKKVYIIDEVHMLTTEAFNALLKTLEEPPHHVLFVLCTTEPHKVPQTIASRCFHIAFPLASKNDIVRSLKRIVKGEKLMVDAEALLVIASLSDGSFRDGAKIFEEVVMKAGRRKITKKLIEERYRMQSVERYLEALLDALAKKDAKEALSVVGKIVDQGVDMKYFIEQLITELHEFLLVKVGVKTDGKVEGGEWKMEEIKELVQILTKAHAELKYAVLPQLPLELAVLEWADSAARGPVSLHPHPTSSLTPFAAGVRRGSPALATPRSATLLEQLIETVKPHNHSIAGVLRGCSIVVADNTLTIQTKYKFHKERLSEQKTLHLLEKVSGEITGKKSRVVVELVGR